ncbi:MAG: undecaprenyl-phosphate glucose phosphotransferase [Candidatus Omnitrophica bacterium]|nr:undecaprenyl-phosphate glucose phosphotransferase [Candidatus Omnitrophota bacterium]
MTPVTDSPATQRASTHAGKNKKHYGLLIWLWISDICLIITAHIAAYGIRFMPGMPVFYGVPPFSQYVTILPFTALVYYFCVRFYGLYRPTRLISGLEEFFLVTKAVALGALILMASSFVYREYTYSRIMLILSALLLILFLCLNRTLFRYLVSKLAKRYGFQRNILLAGHGPAIRHLIRGMSGYQKGTFAIVGLLSHDPAQVGTHVSEVAVIGTLNDFERILSERDVDEVILGELNVPRQRILQMIMKCEEKMASFKMISDLLGSMTSRLDVEHINGVPLLGIRETPLNYPVNRGIKRCMDIVVSFLSLVVLGPLMLLTALVVKLSDGGSVLYAQSRVGEDGKIFNIYKFRSMKVDAESRSGPQFAEDEDPRRTPLGGFLRKTNIDELPQLWNVLCGDMSLVGPRPERPVFVDQLKTDIPRYMSRHRVRSGITGWAQVNGLRGGPPSEERIQYDLYYIENWSLWLDIKILIMTAFAYKGAK